jgi:hypothetical protein
VLLALEVASEAVGSQHLQGAEEDKQAQTAVEEVVLRHLGELLGCLIVFVDEIAAQLVGILGRCLPQE